MVADLLVDGPESARFTIVLAHGAGAAMDSPYMARVARDLAARSLRVVRFEFPYMRARREGRRPGPDREPVLLATWREVASQFDPLSTVIGGKSMGGRMASMVADELSPRGLICLGYPFHPPGRPDKLRTAHLESMTTPALIVQGERDQFGGPEEVAGYHLSPAIEVHWIADGDHDLKPRKASGRTHNENLGEAVEAIVAFVERLNPSPAR